MIRPYAYLAAGLAIGAVVAGLLYGYGLRAGAGSMTVPSGQVIRAHQILWEDHEDIGERWVVLRFTAPQIARELGKLGFADIEPDLQALCETVGLPVVGATGGADQVLVQLMSRPVARGETAPDVTQFGNAFSINDGACVWE